MKKEQPLFINLKRDENCICGEIQTDEGDFRSFYAITDGNFSQLGIHL